MAWNALGWWVVGGTDVLHDPSGHILGYVTPDGSTWYQQFVPFPGRSDLGFYYGGLWAPFIHPNALGSTQMTTMANGGVMADYELYPWGEVWQEGGTTNYTERFAGFDQIDGNQYQEQFRRYVPPEGRWLSPDPLGGDISNPQSLNRYAYALNNPTTFTDPLGLVTVMPGWPGGGGGIVCDPLLGPAEPTVCDQYPPNGGDPFVIPPFGGGGGGSSLGGSGGGGGGTGGGSTASAPGPGQSELTDSGDQGGPCIQPSWLTKLEIFGGMYLARFLSYGGNGQTKSVSLGVGGSVGGGAIVGGNASVSWGDTVDIYGNAAQVTKIAAGPSLPAGGAGGVAGLQAGKADSVVPTTPQASGGWVFDSTLSAGGGEGLGANVDIGKSGSATITIGAAEGGKVTLSTSLLPVYVISASTPYCHGGPIY